MGRTPQHLPDSLQVSPLTHPPLHCQSDFESRSDSEEEGELVVRLVENQGDAEEYETDSGEEEEWWRPDMKQGDKVQVYFTRNGKVIGKKEVLLPKGGFYPTVG